MVKVKILIIDDEPAIRRLLERSLTGYGYAVLAADNPADALLMAKQQSPDLILLDISLNEGYEGLELCQKLRQWSKTPVIIVSVHDEKQVRLAAFNAGADDYVTKPFDMDELEARIRAVLRRGAYEASKSPSGEIRIDDLRIDLVNRRVTLDGSDIHLTPREFALLKLLASHPGRVLTFGMLLKEVWGQFNSARSEHNVRVYINTLRKKLRDDPSTTLKPRFIFNEPGVGYRFADL